MKDRASLVNGFYVLPSVTKLYSAELEFEKLESKDSGPETRFRFSREPDFYPFDPFIAYKFRLLCFANAAIYALEDAQNAENKIRAIDELIWKKLYELEQFQKLNPVKPVFEAELYQFYNEDLPKASGLTPKDLALAETFYVWQKIDHPVRTTSYRTGSLEITQRETYQSAPLTDAQKASLRSIHNVGEQNQPKWFTSLPLWAQKKLRNIAKSNGDFSLYEKFRPAILRQIPGEANATVHELIVRRRDSGEVISHTRARRQGAPTSFYMKDAAERQQSATQNLQQMIRASLDEAKKSFQDFWGIVPDEQFPLPLLLESLVTPSKQANLSGKLLDLSGASGSENNTHLASEKNIAVAASFPEKQCAELKIFNFNIAINKQRKGDETPDSGFIAFARLFHSTLAEKLQEQKADEKTATLRKNQLRQLAAIIQLIESLSQEQKIAGRNKNLYLAATYDAAIRLMQGLSTGNCKSSKDRKGDEFMMADALLVYAADKIARGKKVVFPAYDAPENSASRRRLVRIFGGIYASGHQLLVSHDNSPGSPGIKDEGILDRDIVRHLQSLKKNTTAQGAFALSRQVAEFNKPGTFWQKNRKTIRRYATIGLAAITTIISIGLCATGFMSPVGLLGIAGSIALSESIYRSGNAVQSYRDNKNTFVAQSARLGVKLQTYCPRPETEKKSYLPFKGGSTARFPFKLSRSYQTNYDNLIANSPTSDLRTPLLSKIEDSAAHSEVSLVSLRSSA